MSKTTKWILIGTGIFVVLLVVLSVAGVFKKETGLKVTAEKASRRNITEVVSASGKIFPEIEVKVSPDISGEITELTVEEGDTVRKGQLLARIYADVYNIQRNQAASGVAQSQAQVANSQAGLGALQATLDQSKRSYDRQKQLFDEKVISRSEFDVAEASWRSAQANFNAAQSGIRGSQAAVQGAQQSLAKANTDLGRTAIIAPMDGVVSLLNVKKGEKVAGNSFNVGTEMLRIADMDKIEVRVDVGENDIPKVKLGDTALVTVEAYSERKFKGLVTQIASSNTGAAAANALAAATNDVTQYKVYIRILKESYADLLGKGSFPFRPGMSASADIQTNTHANVISVPINAVTMRDKNDSTGNKSVVKKEEAEDVPDNSPVEEPDVVLFVKGADDKVQRIIVKTGIQDINNIEITSGLKGNEEVITGPYDVVNKTLKKGTKVRVVAKNDLYKD